MALGQSSNPLEAEDGRAVTVSGPAQAAELHVRFEAMLAAQHRTNELLETLLVLLIEKLNE